jgi:hypothetical protein
VENLLIEEAFSTKQTHAIIDGYIIDFERGVQISDNDQSKQRRVKQQACQRNNQPLREERFMPDPIAPARPFGGQYGWVSPFVIEVRKSLYLQAKQLPSNDANIIPIVVQKAALGIIKEGKLIGKRKEAEKLAEKLMTMESKEIKELWQCCAHLYSLESFLYKKLNEVMRLIGDEKHETVWQSKVHTLGPFCLLLWDNPFSDKLTKNIQLYRGAKLTNQQIATYQELSTRPREYRSFQAFTSCSRSHEMAGKFGNALFIMKVLWAFTWDHKPFSAYPNEEEELIIPGVCFSVQRMEFDSHKNKYLIYLQLSQRHDSKYDIFLHNMQEIIIILLVFYKSESLVTVNPYLTIH